MSPMWAYELKEEEREKRVGKGEQKQGIEGKGKKDWGNIEEERAKCWDTLHRYKQHTSSVTPRTFDTKRFKNKEEITHRSNSTTYEKKAR